MKSLFLIEEVTSFLGEVWITDKIEKRKFEIAKEKLSSQVTDFLNKEFVKRYETEIWFSKCFDMICRDKFLKRIFCHFFELSRSTSIDSLCDSFTDKFIGECQEYSVVQKQISDAIKWSAYEVIRILKNSNDIPKEYVMHFDIYDLGQKTNGLQFETLSCIKQICDWISLNHNRKESLESYKELYAIISKDIPFFQKQYEILEWVSKGNNVKEAMVCLSFLERDEGDVYRAIDLLEYVADKYPEEVNLYNSVGNLYLDIGEYEKANKCFYKVAFSDNGNKGDAYYNLAIWEYVVANSNIVKPPVEGKYFYSINMINRAIKYSPDDVDSLNCKAYLLMISKQKMEEAYSLFCKCIEKEDKYEYRVNLAIFYLLNRDFDRAEAEVKMLLQLQENGDKALLYGLLGNIYGTYGVDRIDDAIKMFEMAYDYSDNANYLSIVDDLRNGRHIDSISLNGTVIEIYTDREVIDFYRKSHNMM